MKNLMFAAVLLLSGLPSYSQCNFTFSPLPDTVVSICSQVHDLSNVTLHFSDGTSYKHDNLNVGLCGNFWYQGKTIVDTCVKAGTCETCYSSLPVELSFFEVNTRADGSNLITWETETEINTKGFTLQRSGAGGNWVNIGDVDAVGFSSNAVRYSLFDLAPPLGVNYYRLLITDFDGFYEFSPVVSVDNTNDGNYLVRTQGNRREVVFSGESLGKFTLFAAGGQILSTGSFSGNTFSVDLSGVGGGLYYLSIIREGKLINVKLSR